jgi:hypothetical protein
MTDWMNDVRIAVVAGFCSQTLGHKLDGMGAHERGSILRQTGVDVTELNNREYTEEVMRESLRRYIEGFRNMIQSINRVMDDTGMEMRRVHVIAP